MPSREVHGGQRSKVFELTTGVCIEIRLSVRASRHMATIVRTSSVFFFHWRPQVSNRFLTLEVITNS